jgi:hypothetical protein
MLVAPATRDEGRTEFSETIVAIAIILALVLAFLIVPWLLLR